MTVWIHPSNTSPPGHEAAQNLEAPLNSAGCVSDSVIRRFALSGSPERDAAAWPRARRSATVHAGSSKKLSHSAPPPVKVDRWAWTREIAGRDRLAAPTPHRGLRWSRSRHPERGSSAGDAISARTASSWHREGSVLTPHKRPGPQMRGGKVQSYVMTVPEFPRRVGIREAPGAAFLGRAGVAFVAGIRAGKLGRGPGTPLGG